MEVKVNVEDYLSEDEIKDLCKDAILSNITYKFEHSKIDDILSNVGYKIVWEMVDKQVPNYTEMITNKVVDIINNLTSYSVFRDVNCYDKSKSEGQKILDQTVKNHMDIIDTKVKNILTNEDIRYKIMDIVYDELEKKFETKVD